MRSIEDVLRNHFIPAIIGESSNCYNLWQVLIALPIRLLTILIALPIQCIKLLTGDIADHIISQNTEYKANK